MFNDLENDKYNIQLCMDLMYA